MNGAKSRRAVLLQGNIIVVEDDYPTVKTGPGNVTPGDSADSDRISTRPKRGATVSLESQLSAVLDESSVYDFKIESRMPWDLQDGQAACAGANSGRSALVYAGFMCRAVPLATDLSNTQLPIDSPIQPLSVAQVRQNHLVCARDRHHTDDSTRDLVIYAGWN